MDERTREPVKIPAREQVDRFLPRFTPRHAEFRASRPRAQGVAVLGGRLYSHFRYQAHLAARNALAVHAEAAADFARIFGRAYDVIDQFCLEDADWVIVMAGSYSSKGKAAVQALRAE